MTVEDIPDSHNLRVIIRDLVDLTPDGATSLRFHVLLHLAVWISDPRQHGEDRPLVVVALVVGPGCCPVAFAELFKRASTFAGRDVHEHEIDNLAVLHMGQSVLRLQICLETVSQRLEFPVESP